MEARRAFTSAARNFSSSSLRERLSSITLTTKPLRPVTNFHPPNIDFVPSKIPRKRRLQTLAVAVWSTVIVWSTFVFLILLSYPPLWPFLAAYMLWVHVLDKSPEKGGRLSAWFRSGRFWRYFADYYPASMLKTCDLPADRPYVFGYHPHGIIGMGALCTFGTESASAVPPSHVFRGHSSPAGTGFSQCYPGIIPHLLTLSSNFRVPFYRDFLLAMGIRSVSKQSCSNILKGGPGQSITIVVGGAAESLSARPGTADLTLRKRLGFIKVAIQHGADLVPVFSFGENDIYHQMPNEKGTTVYALQKKFQNVFGFTLPLFHGRGLLNYNLGLMPYRRRIVVVIGNPVHVEKCEKPTLEEITHVQGLYIEELMSIWNTYKDEFARTRKRELSIIE
ncbi:DAGAT-domain-containing protein [Laetiporus sulphureus 93-53]|uniref:Diacylglycerol O-acyltransferase n=1 Tax=Laetiporus sulphureus 93-53 TaxID=1314785 RepID=A0A165B9Z0_9APHY|nr:DAGAT-domain-containing protein [Laetiporus sulphureus 93-53]KZT00590.1 DAGAT-domain-containing protein [Laetiporus sulphureus 93-53]